MAKVIKLIALVNNKILVSEIEEVGAVEIGQPDCKLLNPVILTTTDEKLTIQEGKVVLTKWLSNFTKEREFMISSDKILTMSDPAPSIVEKYMDLVDKK